MQYLPPALLPLAAYRQFILYRLEPQPDGKTKKTPLDWRTQRAHNPHDPAIWLTADQAMFNAQVYGLGVGFVITAADPFWFLDVDHCLTAGGWSAESQAICAALAGVAVEISQSGTGLHLIGSGPVPEHRIAPNDSLGLYTSGRFVALTGTHATGSAAAAPDMAPVVARWFAPDTSVTPVDWTDGPCDGWRGPADDDELLRRMLASTSAASAFGGRASVQQLWAGDEDALGRAYPGEGRAYDASAADAALAQHLAFWTGRDCERIRRLMSRSALARDKWDREDYLPRTILRACGLSRTVLGEGGAVASAPAPVSTTAPGAPPLIGSLITASDLPTHFAGVVYVEDRYQASAPDGVLLDPQQFRSSGRYGGHKFMLDSEKTTRNAWEAFCESGTYRPPFAHALCFRPELPSRGLVPEDGRVLLNNYVPIVVPSKAGDPARFLAFVTKLLRNPRDQAILLNFMASLVQNPGVKFQWCPVLQGVQGNGKTLILDVISQAIGERYTHKPNAADISNKFNAWLECKLFIGVEEIYVADRRDLLDSLKVMITNRRIEFQGKGANQYTGDNRANFLLCTNHKDAIPKTLDDRRYCVLFTEQQTAEDIVRDGMGGSYFPEMYAWLRAGGFAVVTHYLQTLALAAELDPAGACHRAPLTSTTTEAVAASLGVVEQAIVEAAASGDVGFRGGWVSSHWLGVMLAARRLANRAPPNQWDALLASLGYIRHPALVGGRVNNEVMPEAKKSRLWVKAGTIAHLNLDKAADVARAYTSANSDLAPSATRAG